jgi:hypothetical protein
MSASATSDLSTNWPTIYQLASQIQETDLTRARGTGNRFAKPITDGLTPEPFPVVEGYRTVTPEQLATLRVPVIEVGNEIKGFQREKVNGHVRKIARALIEGEEMPPLIISIFPDGNAYVDDGQHRALAGIMARKPLEVVVKHRTVDQARKLFAAQGRAKSLRSDDTLLTGDSPLELYIQDALTSDTHPWSGLVTPSRSTTHRMTPTTMAVVVGAFVYNALSNSVISYTRRTEEFDEKLGAQLADMVKAFGNQTTNPLAFKGRTLRAVSYAAVHIFRRNPNARPGDLERWKSHMPKFDFGKFPHLLGKETEMALMMVEHWNKRLPEDRRVRPYHQMVA